MAADCCILMRQMSLHCSFSLISGNKSGRRKEDADISRSLFCRFATNADENQQCFQKGIDLLETYCTPILLKFSLGYLPSPRNPLTCKVLIYNTYMTFNKP